MYSFVYFSFFTNLSKILAVTVWLLFEKDFEYLSIDLYLLQDWSKHFYARVFFFYLRASTKNCIHTSIKDFSIRLFYEISAIVRYFALPRNLDQFHPKKSQGFLKKPNTILKFL